MCDLIEVIGIAILVVSFIGAIIYLVFFDGDRGPDYDG